MKLQKQVDKFISENEIDVRTISFYQTYEDDQMEDSEGGFGTCDITGLKGQVCPCVCRVKNSDEIFSFEALDTLVGGYLGKLAGAF